MAIKSDLNTLTLEEEEEEEEKEKEKESSYKKFAAKY